jgi:hypothetical protein
MAPGLSVNDDVTVYSRIVERKSSHVLREKALKQRGHPIGVVHAIKIVTAELNLSIYRGAAR